MKYLVSLALALVLVIIYTETATNKGLNGGININDFELLFVEVAQENGHDVQFSMRGCEEEEKVTCVYSTTTQVGIGAVAAEGSDLVENITLVFNDENDKKELLVYLNDIIGVVDPDISDSEKAKIIRQTYSQIAETNYQDISGKEFTLEGVKYKSATIVINDLRYNIAVNETGDFITLYVKRI